MSYSSTSEKEIVPNAAQQLLAVPQDLGKDIKIVRSKYVRVHCSERLYKDGEMYSRFYMFDCVEEVQGEYQLWEFIEDNTM